MSEDEVKNEIMIDGKKERGKQEIEIRMEKEKGGLIVNKD